MFDLFENIWRLLPLVFMMTTPIFIAAIGGMICERAGVVNIALEGLMTIGAMSAATTHVLLESSIGFSIPLAMLVAATLGCLFSMIHAFASITLKADQIISGTGINLLSLGITVFFCQLLFSMDRTVSHRTLISIGFGGVFPTTWLALAILGFFSFMLYKRPWGLRLRAAGEHPQALASAGVNVIRIRYIAVLISGALAGLAGACIVLTETTEFAVNSINGRGFIALAAVSFGRWIPLGVLGASFLFGFSSVLAVIIINNEALRAVLPAEFFNLLPYFITLLALVIFSGKDFSPKAVGQPYDKGK